MAGKLEAIARDMRDEASWYGRTARRELSRGLVLEMWAEAPGFWVLRLSRPVNKPSEREIAIARAAFGVPDEALAFETGDQVVWMRWRP